MRKQSKKVENRSVPLFVIESGTENHFPKMQGSNYTVANWETMLVLFEEYKHYIEKGYYSDSIFAHQDHIHLPEKDIKKLTNFSEYIYTNQLITVIKSYTSVISVGKVYEIIIHKDNYFPKGEKCVIGDDGQLVTLLCFKYQIYTQ